MAATVLAIDDRRKPVLVGMARPSDFATHETGWIELSGVLDPTLSLYCIDPLRRAALFVRTPPELDLSSVPFLYQAQYTQAIEVVSVPFGPLHELAARSPIPPERLVLVQSTGRCGSTLVSHALAAGEGVVSLSEPDIYSQLHHLRDQGDSEFEALLKTCTTMLCVPRPAVTWAIKFRNSNIELAEPLLRSFPGATTVFLYRNAETAARSGARAFGLFSPRYLVSWDRHDEVLPRVRSVLDGPVLSPFPSPVEFMCWMWATSMTRATILQRQGVPMFITRYEDLSARPLEVLAALCEYCGVRVSQEALAAVVARDSQGGTEHSRAREVAPGGDLTDEHLAAIRRCLAEMAPELAPDQVLPGTYGTRACWGATGKNR